MQPSDLNEETFVVDRSTDSYDLFLAIKNNENIELSPDIPEIPIIENLAERILQQIERYPLQLDMNHWFICRNSEGVYIDEDIFYAFNSPECGSTLCLAGYTMALVEQSNKYDEFKLYFDNPLSGAAAIIWYKNTGVVPNFYGTNKYALKFLREISNQEKKDA